jgi:hypothetical protein
MRILLLFFALLLGLTGMRTASRNSVAGTTMVIVASVFFIASFYRKRLFVGIGSKQRVVEGFWCETLLKLSNKVQTPLGSKVSVLRVCVDIYYSVKDTDIILKRVQLSRSSRIGNSLITNVASDRTGEAWQASCICPVSYLVKVVQKDLSIDNSRLRRIMLAKWRDAYHSTNVKSLVDALNSRATPEQIESLIATTGRSNEIIFTYTKPNGVSEIRRVSVMGMLGPLLRARDYKDDKVKSFRLDRITNAWHV